MEVLTNKKEEMFKKKRITKMRRLIKDKRWLKEKLNSLYEYSQWLHSFKRWECDSFFVGYTVADKNLKHYYKQEDRNNRRIAFIESCLAEL